MKEGSKESIEAPVIVVAIANNISIAAVDIDHSEGWIPTLVNTTVVVAIRAG